MVHDLAIDNRAARREVRRAAILKGARAVVAEGGLDALKLKPLATRLGYAVGALYRYFDGKEALVAALEVQALEVLGHALERAADRGGAGAEHVALARVIARCEAYLRFPEHDAESAILIAHAVGDPRVLVPGPDSADVYAAAQPIFAALATDLHAAAEAGVLEPGPAVDRAVVLWSGLQGVLQTRKLSRVAPDVLATPRLAATYVRTILRGWGAAPEPLAATTAHVTAVAGELME